MHISRDVLILTETSNPVNLTYRLQLDSSLSLFINIATVTQNLELVLEDFINYLHWDTARVNSEIEQLEIMILDATTY